eukprot:gene8736-9669_t
MAKHHPDLIFCRKQPGVAIGRLCEKCDGRCVICDSYVRPCTLVRICDECNYGSYQGRCVICGGPGVSDAYYCKGCTVQEKDRDGCPKIVNLGSSKTDLFYERKNANLLWGSFNAGGICNEVAILELEKTHKAKYFEPSMESQQDDFTQLLKPVFDSCDTNGDGFVKINDLLLLGKQHAFEHLEELEPILKQLDPKGHGRITFQDFCRRVHEITSGHSDKETDTAILPEQRPRSFTDSEGFFEDNDSPTHSTASTNDYYGDSDDFVPPTLHNSHQNNNNSRKSKQNFNIYSTYPINGIHKHKKKYPSIFLNDQLLATRDNGQPNEEGFEAFGEASDADETASLHSDYSSPEKNYSKFGRRISGSLAASNIENYALMLNSSALRVIESLSSQVSSLQVDQEHHREKQKKSKDDNRKLLERINILEELLHEAKAETARKADEESQKYKLSFDRRFAQQKIEDLNESILERDRMMTEMRHRLRNKNDEIERMKNDRLQEIAELTEELESLRSLKHAATVQCDEKNELIREINRLKIENDKLKNTKDDLRDQLLEHKTFFDSQQKESLADELLSADKDEVLKVLKEQELDNHRMRQYIDMLLMLIMETDPSLLEKIPLKRFFITTQFIISIISRTEISTKLFNQEHRDMNFLKKYFAHYLIALLVISCQSFAENVRDYCVIGAGPAGLQMGYFLERASRDYIILERDISAGQTNKEFNLRHDWNSLISDDESLLKTLLKGIFSSGTFYGRFLEYVYVKYLNDYATKLKLNVKYNANIRLVTKDNATGVFTLLDKNDEMYMCKTLIVSTGLWVENIPRNITGIENTVSYSKMSVNPDDYEGKNIFIIGRGNSAFETAQSLAGAANYIHMMSRERLRFAWETHYVGDVRAVNDGPIDTYQLKSLDGQFEGDIRAISFTKNKDGKIVVGSSNEDEPDNSAIREPYDTVIRCMGFRFDNSIFSKNIRPKKSAGKAKKYPAVKNNYESTVTDGMFFAGTIIHSLDWRKSAGGFIHGFRYTTRALHRILEHRNHGVKWPHLTLPNTELLNTLTKRLNEASGTYQMLNELVDVIVLSDDDHFQYFEELPKGLLPNFTEITGVEFQRGIVVNLEYGKNFSGPGSDPFKEERATGEVVEAHMSNFLHPVLYYYKNPITKLDENKELPKPDRLHHIVEDFLAFWNALVHHHLPLRWFLEFATEEDLRHFYAEDCFKIAMTNKKMPYFCDEHFLKGFALSQPKPTSTITLDDSTASV